jgi:hypothetical protein
MGNTVGQVACLLLFYDFRVIDQNTFDRLLPRACEWARAQEEFILKRGTPLDSRFTADALRLGVQDPARIRVLVVDRIPLPDDEELAAAARRTQIITGASRAIAIGHGIIIRADAWGDRELVLHQLVHVAQCERNGGLESFVGLYLSDRHQCEEFSIGSLEEEARRMAREICTSNSTG